MEKCKRMKRQLCMSKNWICSWQWKSSRTRQQYCRSQMLCDENGCSCEWVNGQKPHLTQDGIRIICNTENFVPIVFPRLSSSSSAFSSSSRTLVKQESHSSSSSSSSSSFPTVDEISVREGEDALDSDISPMPVSELVDDRSGKLEETQANKIPKPKKKRPR